MFLACLASNIKKSNIISFTKHTTFICNEFRYFTNDRYKHDKKAKYRDNVVATANTAINKKHELKKKRKTISKYTINEEIPETFHAKALPDGCDIDKLDLWTLARLPAESNDNEEYYRNDFGRKFQVLKPKLTQELNNKVDISSQINLSPNITPDNLNNASPILSLPISDLANLENISSTNYTELAKSLQSESISFHRDDLHKLGVNFFSKLTPTEISEKALSIPDEVQVVLYHSPCIDGTSSALVAVEYFGHHTAKVKCIPCSRLQFAEILPKVKGKNVLIADFSFSLHQLAVLYKTCNKFRVLDHHIVNSAIFASLPSHFYSFDVNESGVTLTYKFFFGENARLPRLFNLIKQNDLFSFDDIKSFCFSLGLRKKMSSSKDLFDDLWKLLEKEDSGVQDVITIGADSWNNYYKKACEQAITQARLFQFPNTPYTFLYYEHDGSNSVVGNFLSLLPEADFVILRRVESHKLNLPLDNHIEDGQVDDGVLPTTNITDASNTIYVLRSSSDKVLNGRFFKVRKQVDVSALAKLLDPTGGGHRGASTMCTSSDKLFKFPLLRKKSNRLLTLFQIQ